MFNLGDWASRVVSQRICERWSPGSQHSARSLPSMPEVDMRRHAERRVSAGNAAVEGEALPGAMLATIETSVAIDSAS